MPYYDYRCTECANQFEALQSFEEHDRHEEHNRRRPLQCPRCGSKKVEQVLAPVFVITSKKS